MNSRLGHRLGQFPKHRRSSFLVMLLLAAALCACGPGCVRRRLTVRTTPPGALVYIDGQYIGATPVATDFTYYGTRKIELIKDGFETQTVKQEFLPPWYEYPGLDFINENLNPYEIRDERELHFTLAAQRIVPANELLGRGDQLRGSARQGPLTPMPPAGGGTGVWGGGAVNLAPPATPGAFSPPGTFMPTTDSASQTWVGASEQELPAEAISEGYVRPPPGSTILPQGDLDSPLNYAPLNGVPLNDAPSQSSRIDRHSPPDRQSQDEMNSKPSPGRSSAIWSGFGGGF